MSKRKRGQNEGSIYQRQDGRWAGSATVPNAIPRKRITVYGATRAEARDKLAKALADLSKGVVPSPQKQTLEAYLRWWLEEVVSRRNRPSTHTSYLYLCEKHIIPHLGKARLAQLTAQHIRSFLNERQDSGLSARTVEYLFAVLRRALRVAWKDGLIPNNPAATVDPPRSPSKEMQPFSTDEVRKLLAYLEGHKLETLFLIGVSLGLRRGELIGLQWSDVDLDRGQLRVRYALQRLKRDGAVQLFLMEPKSRKSRRTVDLPAFALMSLQKHKAKQAELRLQLGSRWHQPVAWCEGKQVEPEFVFEASNGQPLDARKVNKIFAEVLKDAGIPHRRVHDMRHTSATLLAVAGVHPKVIQGMLGWQSGALLDTYVHMADEMRKQAAASMDALLNPVAVKVAVNANSKEVN